MLDVTGTAVSTEPIPQLIAEFGLRFQTLNTAEKLQLMCCITQTLYQQQRGFADYSLKSACADQPYPCLSKVMRTVSLLEHCNQGDLWQVFNLLKKAL